METYLQKLFLHTSKYGGWYGFLAIAYSPAIKISALFDSADLKLRYHEQGGKKIYYLGI